jgi:hypothetical protein
MLRYAHLLDAGEFTKFVVLVRDLGPFVVMLIDPESRSRRRDRNPTIGRENLLWVINGHPARRAALWPVKVCLKYMAAAADVSFDVVRTIAGTTIADFLYDR